MKGPPATRAINRKVAAIQSKDSVDSFPRGKIDQRDIGKLGANAFILLHQGRDGFGLVSREGQQFQETGIHAAQQLLNCPAGVPQQPGFFRDDRPARKERTRHFAERRNAGLMVRVFPREDGNQRTSVDQNAGSGALHRSLVFAEAFKVPPVRAEIFGRAAHTADKARRLRRLVSRAPNRLLLKIVLDRETNQA